MFDTGASSSELYKNIVSSLCSSTFPKIEILTDNRLIHQLFSLGPFEISAPALRRLFTHLSLQNSFWTTMRNFVKKRGEDRESCGGFQACSISEDGSIGMIYVFPFFIGTR